MENKSWLVGLNHVFNAIVTGWPQNPAASRADFGTELTRLMEERGHPASQST